MIGDEESAEFIGHVIKEKKPLKSTSKRQSINGLIYFGGVLIFMCIIILLFWQVSKKSNFISSSYIGFHKKDAHLLGIVFY